MHMDGVISGVVGTLGKLTSGVAPKLLVATPFCLYDHVIVDDLTPVIALGIVCLLDWILGIFRALVKRELSSRALVSGLGKLFVYMILICVANQIAIAVPMLELATTAVYAYIAVTEFTSVIENAEDLGFSPPIFHFIYKFIARRDLGSRHEPAGIEKLIKRLRKKTNDEEATRRLTEKIIKDLPANKRDTLYSILSEKIREMHDDGGKKATDTIENETYEP